MLPDLSSLASELFPVVIAAAWKGALLLAIALAAVTLLARRSAATRHAVLLAALAGALVFPVLVFVAPSWNVPIAGQSGGSAESIEAVASAPDVLPVIDGSPVLVPALEALPAAPALPGVAPEASNGGVPATETSWLGMATSVIAALPGAEPFVQTVRDGWRRMAGLAGQWQLWLLLTWLGGMFLVGSRWSASYASARRIVDEAEPLEGDGWESMLARQSRRVGVERQVRLLRSERLAVPVVWGARSPAILLPADCDEWPADRREVVLMHELAHVARHDALTQMIGQAAVALHWFNPLAWIAYRRSLAEREQACDDLVLVQGTRASEYAGHIVQIARRYRQESLALSAVAAMARSSELNGRVEAILSPDRRRNGLGSGRAAMLAVAAAVVALPLAAFSPFGGDAPAAEEAAEALAPIAPQVDGADDWRWEGRIASGTRVEVHGLNGSVRVREGSGSTVRVQGTPRGRGAQVAQLVVNETRGVLAVCVVHEGQQGCRPGNGPSGRARNTRNATVNLEVTVPQRTPVALRTTNGSIQSDELNAAIDARTTNGSVNVGSRTGDVRVRTTNGAIRLTAAGRVDASTTNGSIEARMLETRWQGTTRLATTNGAVRVHLPANASVRVDARTSTGSIRSAFDQIEIQRRRGPGGTASGTLGRGGRTLEIRTTNGGITISRGSGTSDARHAIPADHGVAAAVAELESIDWEAVREEARRTQEQARIEMERARQEMAAIDWEAISAEAERSRLDAMRDLEEVRAEMERIDLAAIAEETRAGLEQARGEMEAIDWEAIRREVQDAQEEVRRELERSRVELEGFDWSEIQRTIDDALEEVRRGFEGPDSNGA